METAVSPHTSPMEHWIEMESMTEFHGVTLRKMDIRQKDRFLTTLTESVCLSMNLSVPKMYGKNRSTPIKEVRQMLLTVANLELQMSCSFGARHFNKDHATLLHSKRVVSNFLSIGDELFCEIFEIVKFHFERLGGQPMEHIPKFKKQ